MVTAMPGASEQTSQVKVLNLNWSAGQDGEDGRFEVMIVTRDGKHYRRRWQKCAARSSQRRDRHVRQGYVVLPGVHVPVSQAALRDRAREGNLDHAQVRNAE